MSSISISPESAYTRRLAGVEITYHERTHSSVNGLHAMRASFIHPDGQWISVTIGACRGDLGDNARLADRIRELTMN